MKIFKKVVLIVILAISLIVSTGVVFADSSSSTASGTKLVLHINDPIMYCSKDGTEDRIALDASPYFSEETTMVPVRAILEPFNATLEWYKGGGINIYSGNTAIMIQLGSKTALVNGKKVTLPAAPETSGTRTMVPLRFISENFGFSVQWIKSTSEIIISSAAIDEETFLSPRSGLYYKIKDALENIESTIDISEYNIDVSNTDPIMDAWYQVAFDNPLLVDAGKRMSYSSDGILEFTYTFSQDEIIAMREKLNEKADEIISAIIKPGMSDYQKELVIHDYIIRNARYDSDNYYSGTIPELDYTAYGILVDGVGVCEGYAKAMSLLSSKAGIESILVTGKAVSNQQTGSTESHAWNIVKIDGHYYQIDTTWDDYDYGNTVDYDYFNITDSQMAKDHTWDRSKYPQCISTEESYR
jgi:hypothetical protein